MHPTAIYAVIMAGGSGTRFWPLSRGVRPKQLVRILGDTTMIQATVARLQPLIPAERVLVITTAALAEETRRQLPMLVPGHVIAEPVGRDTAACVALAALIVEQMSPGATMILLPADQVITPADAFQEALAAGAAIADAGSIVTFGITPRFAATGYGYIEMGAAQPSIGAIGVNQVSRFVEKPDRARAEQYVASGNFRWNAGIFSWRADVCLRELAIHVPWLSEAMTPVGEAWGTPRFAEVLEAVYRPLKKVSIDYALMEKAKDVRVITGRFAWDDVGAWDALYDHLPADLQGVIARGDVTAINCRDTLVQAEDGMHVAVVGVEGLTIVATRDAVLVIPKGRSQEVKQIVERLAKDRPGLI